MGGRRRMEAAGSTADGPALWIKSIRAGGEMPAGRVFAGIERPGGNGSIAVIRPAPGMVIILILPVQPFCQLAFTAAMERRVIPVDAEGPGNRGLAGIKIHDDECPAECLQEHDTQ